MSPNDIRLRIFGDFEMVQSIEEWTKRKKQLSKQETIMKICLFDIIPQSKIWKKNALGSIIGNKKEYLNERISLY